MGILRYQFPKFCFNLRSEGRVNITWRQNGSTIRDCGETHRGACSFEGKEVEMLNRDTAWGVWVPLDCPSKLWGMFGECKPARPEL